MKYFKKLALSALIFSLSFVAHAQSNTVPNKTLAPSLTETVLFWVTEGDASADWKAPLSLVRSEIIQSTMDVGAGNDLTFKLGDAAGANKWSLQDSASAEVFSINSDGVVKLSDGNASAPALIGTKTNVGIYFSNSGDAVDITIDGSSSYQFNNTAGGAQNGFRISQDIPFGWTSGTAAGSSSDTQLWRDASGILAQRVTTNPQTSRIYTTWTDVSNYERLALTGSSITVETAGTGTDDIDLNLTPAGTGKVAVFSDLTVGSSDQFKVTTNGDVLSTFTLLNGSSTANGAGSSSTTLILQAGGGTNFDVGNYVLVNSTYAKITAKSTDTLTISPALTWADLDAVTEQHIPEIGGTNLTDTLTNRFGRGYFIDGIVTGNGTTFFSDGGITTVDGFVIDSNNDGINDFVVKSDGGTYFGTSVITDDSAKFQIDSTTQGFLPPRGTSAQRDAITNPGEGLFFYDLTNNKPDFFDGTTWQGIVSSPVGSFLSGGIVFATDSHKIDDDPGQLHWDSVNKRMGLGTSEPKATLDVTGLPGASVGGFASGQFHVTSPATVVNSNSVITGHSSFNGNTQLWYFGSTSSSNNDIAFINRQNGAIAFLTNNAERLRISNTGVLSAPDDLDLTTGTGGVFKFGSVAIRAGLDAVEYVEMGHGGGNGFIDAVGDGGLDFRFEGATLATFTDFGHLHLKTDVDQKHTLKIITANNLNDTGIAWENSGGSFTGTIFRTDVGTNRADIVFAAGINADVDLLTEAIRIHGADAEVGKVEIVGPFQIASGSPAANRVLTSDATGNATWQVPSADTTIYAQLNSSVDQIPTDTNPVCISYNNHDAINGLTHSTTVNPCEITIDTSGIYFVSPQPQVSKDSGGIKVDFDMFLQVDRGAGFVDEDNSNIKLAIKDSDITDVIVSNFTILLNVGDKIQMMQKVSSSTVGMGLKNTDPVVGPPTVPRTPSIIFTMYRVGG